MDICPLPWSSCYLTSSCFLQVSSSQSFWSQPPCCLPCCVPLTQRSFFNGFHLRWMPLPSSLWPPCSSQCWNPAAALPCCAPGLAPFPLLFNAVMFIQRCVPTIPAKLMRLESILFFTVTRLHCNPHSQINPKPAAAQVHMVETENLLLSAQAKWFLSWKEWGGRYIYICVWTKTIWEKEFLVSLNQKILVLSHWNENKNWSRG